MPFPASDKTPITALLAVFLMILAAGCGEERRQGADLKNSGDISESRLHGADNEQALDFGEDWAEREARPRDRRAAGQRPVPGRTAQPRDERNWAIVLGTYSHDDHAQAARTMQREIRRIAPELTDIRVHSTDSGSMVVYGRYTGPDSDSAREDLRKVRRIELQGMPVFPRAFLSRIQGADDRRPGVAASEGEHTLMSVRERFPDRHPLYTLQVAVWSDFDTGEMSRDEIQRRAESYMRELRGQGHDAYVHHSRTQPMSLVTVGLFGSNAIDREGMLSPEVERLLREFPVHLVNGEELNEPVDPQRPDRGTRTQQPQLVLVPRR